MKKFSYSWQKEAEEYFGWTPHPKIWFEFLGWITALSTLQFLSDKTASKVIQLFYYISFVVLFNHIDKIIWTTKFQRFLPHKFSDNVKKLSAYAISALLVAAVYLLITTITKDLTKSLNFS